MCYNTLKRANQLFNEDEEKREKIRNIMYKEDLDYDGKTRVIHALELLRDEIGLDTLKKQSGESLKGLKLAPYYGCMLLRPDGMGVDEAEDPSVFEDILTALGAESVYFPFRVECCGAYQTAQDPEIVAERTRVIVESARQSGADALVVSCPLCAFNLDQRQRETSKLYTNFEHMPVLYITECLAMALGVEYKPEWKELHNVPVDAVLEKVEQEKAASGAKE